MLIIGSGTHVNSAKVKDIRWDLMEKENIKGILPYEEYIKKSYYSEEYLKAKYPDQETYMKCFTKFYTYAVLTPDGTWHEPGKMGWWGMSYATPEEERKFIEQYEEKFLKNINPEWQLTIVDCHI